MTKPLLPQELRCAWCKKKFMRPNGVGPVPTYCSQLHRQRAFEQRRIDRAVAKELKKRGLT